MALADRLSHLWNDQEELNKLFRPDGPPTDPVERIALTKEMSLHMFSEVESLLRALGAWKVHRRVPSLPNREAIKIELADIGKYWITLCQIHGVSAQEAFEMMRTKSMVVRQRHSEEWVQDLARPSVVIDIDNVLADFVTGFVDYLVEEDLVSEELAAHIISERQWVSAEALGMDQARYNFIRHQFRVQNGFAALPVMPGAKGFLEWCREHWQVILLTSRPIHDYPNIYSDTLMWLHHHELVYDRIWWARDKADILQDREIVPYIVFAVDDERKYIEQMANVGVQTYWFRPREKWSQRNHDRVYEVNELKEIIAAIERGTHERK